MKILVPDRFHPFITLRVDRQSKTFLANDQLLDRNDIILRIIRKDHLHCDRLQLAQAFSWLTGLRHSQIASVLDAGFTTYQHLYYVRESLPASEFFSIDPLFAMKGLV